MSENKMWIDAEVVHENLTKEVWEVHVTASRLDWYAGEVVKVHMNADTIVCMSDVAPFKTYAWPKQSTGHVLSAAVVVATRYIEDALGKGYMEEEESKSA